MLTAEQFDSWIAELRNPENEQAQGQLCKEAGEPRVDEDGNASRLLHEKRAYCCLGLMSEKVLGIDLDAILHSEGAPWREMSGILDADAPRGLAEALTYHQRADLALKNDEGQTFQEIANYLEAHRDEYVSQTEGEK